MQVKLKVTRGSKEYGFAVEFDREETRAMLEFAVQLLIMNGMYKPQIPDDIKVQMDKDAEDYDGILEELDEEQFYDDK